jgi:penicillin G amidase
VIRIHQICFDKHLSELPMHRHERDTLRRLGAGESILAVCAAAGMAGEDFPRWWKECLSHRLSLLEGTVPADVRASVRIERDARGVPRILAESDEDLYYGFGYAMAQDRLFQLDYLRRKGAGRLAEILGPSGVETDLIARTVGLPRIAAVEWERLPDETRSIVTAFAAGVNAAIDALGDTFPIEFDLLDYRPEPWSPVDCLVIENEFRWYLTGRLPVIVIPELAKRALGEGRLYREFLQGEADEECILPPGTYPTERTHDLPEYESIGAAIGGPDDGTGSNNWVVAGRHTAGGQPMVASDPHIAFEAVSCWYQARLRGGSFDVAGMTYAGMPAIMFGRNRRVAWGITNNICSQRDLYQEQTDPQHPGCFLYDGRWEPARELTETIHVKGAEPVVRTIRFSRNGPIVDELLPLPARQTGPVSLNWLGAHHGGWLTALLHMDRANNATEFVDALRPWHVPTFSLVFADADGQIGYKAAGRIPLRRRSERGYRRGWDPADQWTGLIPFEAMPADLNPKRGWIVTANNRVAGDDFPYPLSGTWTRGHRAVRIREMLEERIAANRGLTREDFRDIQQDALSLRAVERLPALLDILADRDDDRIQAAAEILARWNRHCEPQEVGPTIFNVFFSHWAGIVAAERFDQSTESVLVAGIEGLAARLLSGDEHGWFHTQDRRTAILAAMNSALDLLTDRFGADMQQWTWEKLHRMLLKHVLSSRGELSQLLDYAGMGVKGDMGTVCNSGSGPDWTAPSGAGCRMIASLDDAGCGLWAVDGQSQSGQPGSPHYADQLQDWLSGREHYLAIEVPQGADAPTSMLTLNPR